MRVTYNVGRFYKFSANINTFSCDTYKFLGGIYKYMSVIYTIGGFYKFIASINNFFCDTYKFLGGIYK